MSRSWTHGWLRSARRYKSCQLLVRGPVVGELSARCYLAAGGGGNPRGGRGRAGQGVATLGTTPALHGNEEPHSPRTCGRRAGTAEHGLRTTSGNYRPITFLLDANFKNYQIMQNLYFSAYRLRISGLFVLLLYQCKILYQEG